MMDRMKIIFHKELKAKNAETNKLFFTAFCFIGAYSHGKH